MLRIAGVVLICVIVVVPTVFIIKRNPENDTIIKNETTVLRTTTEIITIKSTTGIITTIPTIGMITTIPTTGTTITTTTILIPKEREEGSFSFIEKNRKEL